MGRRSSVKFALGGLISTMVALLLALGTPAASSASVSAACPNRLSPGFRAYLPACRAYELVSPAYKEGFPVSLEQISSDGLQLLAESFGSFSHTGDIGESGQTYRLARGEGGWGSSPLTEAFSTYPGYHVVAMSADFQNSLWFASKPGQTTADIYVKPEGGIALERVGPGAPPGAPETPVVFAGASSELSHVLFADQSRFGEVKLWPGDTTEEGSSLYEYAGTGNEEPTLVGVSDEHKLAHVYEAHHQISRCGTTLGAPGGSVYNAVSAQGGTVFFTAVGPCEAGEPPVNEVYARIDGERTVAISSPSHPLVQGSGSGPDECDASCQAAAPQPGVFEGASEDGSKVFFLTSQPLLNGDEDGATDLYEAEIDGEGAHARLGRLIQVSRDPNTGQAAEVQGVARVSEDGSHVYFVARGVLTTVPDPSLRSGHREAVAHEENLYVYERDARYPNGHIAFVATLAPGDEADWGPIDAHPAQATPDGESFVFQSKADLTPDQEGRGDEAGQVFEYDAQTETLVRVSRGEDGYGEDGNTAAYAAALPIQNYVQDFPTMRYSHLAVSADGGRVVFTSGDSLTPQAQRGVNNVYEYHDEQIALISDGHDALVLEERPASELLGIDESGTDVFFTTADQLVPQDTDTQVDVYDARIDGGPPASNEPAPCAGDSCQGATGPPPLLLASATASVVPEAPVSPPAGSSTKPKTKPVKRKMRAKTKKAVRRAGRRDKRRAKKADSALNATRRR